MTSLRAFYLGLSFLVGCGSSAAPSTPSPGDTGAAGSAGAGAASSQGGASGQGGSSGTSGQTLSYKSTPWTPLQTPVLEGQFVPDFPFSGDASVLRRDGKFWNYHTCYAIDRQGTDTCLAISEDGGTWALVDTGDPMSLGRVLRSELDAWDAAHETPFAIQWKGETWLYAVGYSPPSAGFLGASSVQLAVARSKDGVKFSQTEGPLFPLEGLDSHGLTSPSLVEYQGELVMLYSGWCLDPAVCPRVKEGKLVSLLGATSSDGLTWKKRPEPVALDTGLPWAPDGFAETHLVFDPQSGKFLLYFQGLAPKAHLVGLGWAEHPFGPWTWLPDPILAPEMLGPWANGGVVAPHALIEENKAYLWFSGEEKDPSTGKTRTFRIGLATAEGPLLLPN